MGLFDAIYRYKNSTQGLLIVSLTIVCVAWVIQILVTWRRKRSRFLHLAAKLPGPKPLPLIGNALLFAGSKPEELLHRTVRAIIPYEGAIPMRVWLGPLLYIVVTDPRDIEIILHSPHATRKGLAYKFLLPFIGDGLISGWGPTWRAHRKLAVPILNSRIQISGYVDSVQRHTKTFISKLKPLANGVEFDIGPYLTRCTVDATCEVIMGCRDISVHEDLAQEEFVHVTENMYKIVHNRMMKVWLYPDCIFRLSSYYQEQRRCQRVFQGFVEKIIALKKEELTVSSNSNFDDHEDRDSVLGQLIEQGKQILNDTELRDEIFTIYLATQDTIALVSSFTLMMLGIHKDVQANVRNELMEVLGNEDVITDSLSNLTYLEMVIKETMRLFPIAPFLIRQLRNDLTLSNCVLPEGCEVVVASHVTQRSSKYWKNPEKFIPERFTAEESADRHPYAFVPFSGGLMGCIGQKFAIMSLKSIVSNVVRNYKIDCNTGMKGIKLKSDISIRSIGGYGLSLKPL